MHKLATSLEEKKNIKPPGFDWNTGSHDQLCGDMKPGNNITVSDQLKQSFREQKMNETLAKQV